MIATEGKKSMARVFRHPEGYQFVHLTKIGMQLVNEFQRHHPRLCMPTPEPETRFIRFGSAEQTLQLGMLVTEVLARDPEIEWQPKPLSKARVENRCVLKNASPSSEKGVDK
jgi:hypothetical protein